MNNGAAIRVVLDDREIREAVGVGYHRVMGSRERKPRFRLRPGDVWRAHIMGSLAEAVVRKHTGWPWPKGVNVFRSVSDVGTCEVRWCGDDNPYLKVRDDERGAERCICVTGDVGEGFLIQGWMIAADAPYATEAKWIEAGDSSYWRVPCPYLRPMSELIAMGVAASSAGAPVVVGKQEVEAGRVTEVEVVDGGWGAAFPE